MSSNLQSHLNAYFRAKGRPVAEAKAIAAAMEMPRQADVHEFVRRVRLSKGVQDLDLLDRDQVWRMSGKVENGWDSEETEILTETLQQLLTSESVNKWRIDWPSVVSHWGVAVFWTDGGNEYRAFSLDWQITETNMSM